MSQTPARRNAALGAAAYLPETASPSLPLGGSRLRHESSRDVMPLDLRRSLEMDGYTGREEAAAAAGRAEAAAAEAGITTLDSAMRGLGARPSRTAASHCWLALPCRAGRLSARAAPAHRSVLQLRAERAEERGAGGASAGQRGGEALASVRDFVVMSVSTVSCYWLRSRVAARLLL